MKNCLIILGVFFVSLAFYQQSMAERQKISYEICPSGKNPVIAQLPDSIELNCNFAAPYTSYCDSRFTNYDYEVIKLFEGKCRGNVYKCQFPLDTEKDCFFVKESEKQSCISRQGHSYDRRFQMCIKIKEKLLQETKPSTT